MELLQDRVRGVCELVTTRHAQLAMALEAYGHRVAEAMRQLEAPPPAGGTTDADAASVGDKMGGEEAESIPGERSCSVQL